jgi:hypothetical protein
MKHNLSRPCKTCPFRTDVPPYLHRARVLEIADSIMNRQESFPCHKTVNYDSMVEDEYGDEVIRDRDGESQCAGAEIFLAHQGKSTQLGRIMERLGQAAVLDMEAPVCKSVKELIAVHTRKREQRMSDDNATPPAEPKPKRKPAKRIKGVMGPFKTCHTAPSKGTRDIEIASITEDAIVYRLKGLSDTFLLPHSIAFDKAVSVQAGFEMGPRSTKRITRGKV